MDSDLSAEIARIEAELAQDAEMRQQQQQQQFSQQQQQHASPPQQPQAQPFQFGGENPFAPKPPQQPQPPTQQPQQQQQQPQMSMNPFNIDATPFSPQQQPMQQVDYSQQQQQPYMGGGASMGPNGAAAAAAASQHTFSKDTDSRSIFVGNLPKGGDGGATTTPEELVQFFADCGSILNCTVLKDRATGELKGTAYIEFADYTAMGKAIDTKNNANFKGSTIIV